MPWDQDETLSPEPPWCWRMIALGSPAAPEPVQDLALTIWQGNGGEPARAQFTFYDERGARLYSAERAARA